MQYGAEHCTFTPAMPCLEADGAPFHEIQQPGKQYVSKVYSNDSDALREFSNFNAIVKEADPKSVFTVPVLGTCTARPTTAEINGTIAKPGCGSAAVSMIAAMNTSRTRSLRQLVQENAGITLAHAVATVPLRALLLSLGIIINGIHRKFTPRNIIHGDISPHSILYKDGRSKLTDFARMVGPQRDAKTAFAKLVTAETNTYAPPEMTLITSPFTEYDHDAAMTKLSFVLTSGMHGSTAADALHKYDSMVRHVQSQRADQWEAYKLQLMHIVVKTYDVFSIGCVIMYLLHNSPFDRSLSPEELAKVQAWAQAATNYDAFHRHATLGDFAVRWQSIWPREDLLRVFRSVHADIVVQKQEHEVSAARAVEEDDLSAKMSSVGFGGRRVKHRRV